MSFSCRTRVVALATVVVVLAPIAGRAQDDSAKQVDAIIKKAVELRRQGNDRDALTELQRATSIANPPRLTAQIGLAEQALGLWVASDKHLRQAVDQASDPWIKKNRRLLDESLAAVDAHLGVLDVWGEPEGAEVVIDGDVAGTLPLAAPLKLQAGTVELTVRAAHFLPSTRKLELSPGANVREHVVLRAVPVVTQAVAPDSGPQPAVAVTAPPTTTPSDDDQQRSIFTRWWFWTITAAVVAGGVTAVILATRKDAGCGATTCTNF